MTKKEAGTSRLDEILLSIEGGAKELAKKAYSSGLDTRDLHTLRVTMSTMRRLFAGEMYASDAYVGELCPADHARLSKACDMLECALRRTAISVNQLPDPLLDGRSCNSAWENLAEALQLARESAEAKSKPDAGGGQDEAEFAVGDLLEKLGISNTTLSKYANNILRGAKRAAELTAQFLRTHFAGALDGPEHVDAGLL